jgi:hypothetical protein
MAQTASKKGIRDGLGHVHLYMFQNVSYMFNINVCLCHVMIYQSKVDVVHVLYIY